MSCAARKNAVGTQRHKTAAAGTRRDDEGWRLLACVLHLIWQHDAGIGAEHGGLDQHVCGHFLAEVAAISRPTEAKTLKKNTYEWATG